VGCRRDCRGSRHALHGCGRSARAALDVVVNRRGEAGGEAGARDACAGDVGVSCLYVLPMALRQGVPCL
jgi:hypothetical protein